VKILAVYSIKGGVGKTATAVNLAYLSAHEGHRTLVWDLDPQGSASFYFRIKPRVEGGGKALVKGRNPLETAVKGTDFERLDLLPSDFSYRHMDLLLTDAKTPTKQLLRLLRPLAEDYDTVFLDCPPSITLVSENVFRAADALLVPMIPTTLSDRTLSQLLEFLEHRDHTPGLRVLPFFSMVDRRRRLHLELMERLPGEYPGFLKGSIPDCAEVERMGIHRMPLPAYAPGSQAAAAYRALWTEVCQTLAATAGAAGPLG
jgi:chromosome partitioning protein